MSSSKQQLKGADFGADGFRPKDVRSQKGGSDFFARIGESVAVQPSLYAGIGTMALLFATQIVPEHFLPQRLLGRRFHGITAQRFYALPLAMIACSYIGVADRINDDKLMGGHTAGLAVSTSTFLFLSYLGSLSPYWPTIGLGYMFFGGFHHFRNLRYYYDGAPLISFGDFGEIAYDVISRESKRRAREQAAAAKAQREALLELAASEREKGRAAVQ